MFTSEDLDLIQQAGSWEKVGALREAFFPKLGALQVKANQLIHDIYNIDINSSYKISQTPTFPSRKGQEYNSERRYNDNAVQTGLRGKGLPSNLKRPNGKLCKMHFALMSFAIFYEPDLEPQIFMGVNFLPYSLRYADIHRAELSISIIFHEVHALVPDLGEWILSNPSLDDFSDQSFLEFFFQDAARLCVSMLDPLSLGQEDMAELVIAYAGCFPMLDLFTRLSNGEKTYEEKGEDFIPVNDPNYYDLFLQWCEQHAENYVDSFHVEPIQQEDVWRSEAATRAIFEELLDRSFPKLRPSWLRTSRSKASLELDGYCEELNLAFEYQGEYHYMELPIHHQQRSLAEVQKNDEKKLKICRERGVDLIQVPYWEKGSREYIIKQLRKLNRPEIEKLLNC